MMGIRIILESDVSVYTMEHDTRLIKCQNDDEVKRLHRMLLKWLSWQQNTEVTKV